MAAAAPTGSPAPSPLPRIHSSRSLAPTTPVQEYTNQQRLFPRGQQSLTSQGKEWFRREEPSKTYAAGCRRIQISYHAGGLPCNTHFLQVSSVSPEDCADVTVPPQAAVPRRSGALTLPAKRDFDEVCCRVQEDSGILPCGTATLQHSLSSDIVCIATLCLQIQPHGLHKVAECGCDPAGPATVE